MHRVVKYLHGRRNDGDWIDLNKNRKILVQVRRSKFKGHFFLCIIKKFLPLTENMIPGICFKFHVVVHDEEADFCSFLIPVRKTQCFVHESSKTHLKGISN